MSLEILAGAASAWVWENYGKAIFEKVGEKAKEKWTAFNWKEAAENYRAAL